LVYPDLSVNRKFGTKINGLWLDASETEFMTDILFRHFDFSFTEL
jgi:hypothetical protein